jgi:hypothetical protein
MVAATFGLAAVVLGFLVSFVAYGAVAGAVGNGSSALPNLTVLLAVGIDLPFAFALPLFLLLGSAFKAFEDADFRTPYLMTWVGLGGVALGGVASLVLTGILLSASASTSSGGLAGVTGLFVLAGLLLLIGAIGVILGLWRAGEWFESGGLKAAAIVMIFASPAAFVMILVVCYRLYRDRTPSRVGNTLM